MAVQSSKLREFGASSFVAVKRVSIVELLDGMAAKCPALKRVVDRAAFSERSSAPPPHECGGCHRTPTAFEQERGGSLRPSNFKRSRTRTQPNRIADWFESHSAAAPDLMPDCNFLPPKSKLAWIWEKCTWGVLWNRASAAGIRHGAREVRESWEFKTGRLRRGEWPALRCGLRGRSKRRPYEYKTKRYAGPVVNPGPYESKTRAYSGPVVKARPATAKT